MKKSDIKRLETILSNIANPNDKLGPEILTVEGTISQLPPRSKKIISKPKK